MKELRIGVVGYCPPSRFDTQKAIEMLKEAYDSLAGRFPEAQKTVVSGLTHEGIPALAYEEAAARGWRTVGIACSKADNHPCFPVDKRIIVGTEWGDESNTFLGSIDVLVRVGGGKQSMRETAEAKKQGKPVIEYELPALEDTR